jgi:hypothetical protein
MKKICEIYDVSLEYKMQDNSVLVIVSDIEQNNLFKIFPELNQYFDKVLTSDEWQKYLDINNSFHRNESKHNMREIRRSKKVEMELFKSYETDTINDILDNEELNLKIEKALSSLSETPKRRLLKHYSEHITYRKIAEDEGKAVSTIYESIQTARKKFLKNFK